MPPYVCVICDKENISDRAAFIILGCSVFVFLLWLNRARCGPCPVLSFCVGDGMEYLTYEKLLKRCRKCVWNSNKGYDEKVIFCMFPRCVADKYKRVKPDEYRQNKKDIAPSE